MKPERHAIVMTTVETESEAVRIANAIVDAKLAACVQFWPIRSVYNWKGRRSTGREHLLMCKTRLTAAKPLQALILTLHTYELPEIVAVPITTGHPAYLNWINGETTPAIRSPRKQAPSLTFRRQGTKTLTAKKRGKI